MSNPLINFAMAMISRNPQIANNPQAQNMIDVIKTGDSKKGEEIAENLCASYGVNKDDAINQAKKFFNIP